MTKDEIKSNFTLIQSNRKVLYGNPIYDDFKNIRRIKESSYLIFLKAQFFN
jgi:hypothetical protein